MSLNYDKTITKKGEGESFWASYSDLYTMLSAVFLLLYVVTSLRTGTNQIRQQMENERLVAEAQDLREQARVYNTLKDNFLESKATEEEQKTYQELMNKLTLLQDEAREEKNELRQAALDNEAKERALNKYQQIVRNIINANMLAKAGIQQRDKDIAKKKQTIASLGQQIEEQEQQLDESEQTLAEQQKVLEKQEQAIAVQKNQLEKRNAEVADLKEQIDAKRQAIESNQQKIQEIEQALSARTQELTQTQQREKTSKAKLKEEIEKLQAESAAAIEGLKEENQQATSQISQVAKELEGAKGRLAATEKALGQSAEEKERLAQELAETTGKLQGQIGQMKAAFEEEMAAKKAAFEDELGKQKLSAKAKAEKEKAFRDAADKRGKELGEQIAALNDKIKDAEGKLKSAEEKGKKFQDYIAALEKEKGELSKDLQATQDQLRNQKQLAQALQKAFDKAKIKATVDPKTGDVTINFPEYFDTGRADLKEGMRKTLEKLIPVYSDNLFKDPKIAAKIGAVEIVGFASPTYKGKYVDPESLSGNDREAVNYNLDLSYNRAKSIFNHIFDTEKMKYKHQKQLLPLVKVTGRSYLAEGVKGMDVESGLSVKEFCAKYECSKEQKVVIRFNLKD